ncbi:hypothetical protein M378DRAFT_16733 [Amanita muscaria Koide BX008]|uniref:Uncharacterized protein n=1 Tax=Amanita muscaria (strain Koide BX008) TaxID=946122 RepID=A0A0C2WJJ5_AMAMK|nr:hypothetical protein M378DRAFT_16733 [Amanita muscaria Koide BX008]
MEWRLKHKKAQHKEVATPVITAAAGSDNESDQEDLIAVIAPEIDQPEWRFSVPKEGWPEAIYDNHMDMFPKDEVNAIIKRCPLKYRLYATMFGVVPTQDKEQAIRDVLNLMKQNGEVHRAVAHGSAWMIVGFDNPNVRDRYLEHRAVVNYKLRQAVIFREFAKEPYKWLCQMQAKSLLNLFRETGSYNQDLPHFNHTKFCSADLLPTVSPD